MYSLTGLIVFAVTVAVILAIMALGVYLIAFTVRHRAHTRRMQASRRDYMSSAVTRARNTAWARKSAAWGSSNY